MSFRLRATLRDRLGAASRPLVGGWVCTGSPLVAEIMAGSGLDWLLVDMEHGPNTLDTVLAQLQAIDGSDATPVVRVPIGDAVTIKQVLDLGAQNILVPMVSTADEARAVVAATRYPPRGRRGVGSALARSARWNRVGGYLAAAYSAAGRALQEAPPARTRSTRSSRRPTSTTGPPSFWWAPTWRCWPAGRRPSRRDG